MPAVGPQGLPREQRLSYVQQLSARNEQSLQWFRIPSTHIRSVFCIGRSDGAQGVY